VSGGKALAPVFPVFFPTSNLVPKTSQERRTWKVYLLKQAIEIDVYDIACVRVEQNILTVPISKPFGTFLSITPSVKTQKTYPKIKPTMDITAAVLLYAIRLASHADGSGNVSMNHS
jgi:hypothetical protein